MIPLFSKAVHLPCVLTRREVFRTDALPLDRPRPSAHPPLGISGRTDMRRGAGGRVFRGGRAHCY
jgi:hypothetical protein